MDADEDDYVFCGTPIEREDDITTSRKKKALAESSGQLRTLAPWKQEVRDEEGRRRFHGAFTGGFSAGFYNTVGSKEGWAPQSFTSSRKSRAEVKQQSIFSFLDDDEKVEMEGHSLRTSSQFDTFGFTASEVARKQAEKEQQERPSAIPGPVPDELLLPAAESIGVKLLLKMGWRQGRSIKDSRTDLLYNARREARKAFLAFSKDEEKSELDESEHLKGHVESELEFPTNDVTKSSPSTPVYVLNPKQDLHGLGFDPFKHAPEFRENKKLRVSEGKKSGHQKAFLKKDNLFAFKSEKIGPGFGIGALEELDAEDEDVYASGYDFENTYVQEIEEPSSSSIEHRKKLTWREKGVLPGFKVASDSESQQERFDPPTVPKDYVPRHRFPTSLETGYKSDDPGPSEVPPPENTDLKVLIEGLATLVARCGRLFEDLSREKNQSNPLFSFLSGGDGHDYYARKLWEERQKRIDQTKPHLDETPFQRAQKMTAESRANILGEKPLERSSKDSNLSLAPRDTVQLQYNLSETFTNPASHNEVAEVAKPFKDDPEKQERFELFLKEKYQGGLRSTDSGRANYMSEAARARERLDFEAAAETLSRAKRDKDLSTQLVKGILPITGMQFTSGSGEAEAFQAEDIGTRKIHPKREEFQWRPSPILCKRFDITDPYIGKPPPPPRMRSKMDSLFFTLDSGKTFEMKDTLVAKQERSLPPSDALKSNNDVPEKEVELELEVENVERPVDLYKAIFSDDSENEEESSCPNPTEDPQKKSEVANVTLNRLIAGDFLESLGKELGLEVPPDVPFSKNKAENNDSLSRETVKIQPGGNKASLEPGSGGTTSTMKELSHDQMANTKVTKQEETSTPHGGKNDLCGKDRKVKITQEDKKYGTCSGRYDRPSTSSSEGERSRKHDKKYRSSSGRHQNYSGSSSGDGRSRKRSRRRRHQSSSDSEMSSDYRERYTSESKRKKKEGSKEKRGSSQKHMKHHRSVSRHSHRRSSHRGPENDPDEAKREKRKWRD